MKPTKSTAQTKRPRGRPVERPMPERIPDTFGNILKTVLAGPPKKGWEYLKQGKLEKADIRLALGKTVYNPPLKGLAVRLHFFERHYEAIAKPLKWKFAQADPQQLVDGIQSLGPPRCQLTA